MNALQPWHLIILVLVVVVLFGAKRLPDAARSVGKSMKVFKAETKDLRQSGSSDGSDADSDTAGSAPAVGPDSRQLPQSSQPADEQVEQLQRQLDELKKQQAQQGGAEQPQRNIG